MDHQLTADMTTISTQAHSLGGKAWTAYFRVIVTAFVLLGISVAVGFNPSPFAGEVLGLAAVLLVAYRFMVLRSFRLYYDANGVLLASGVQPWQKGVTGVKWRDIADAVYYRSFASWVSKSYTIRISQRFSEHSEIVLTSWARGDQLVTTINAQLQHFWRPAECSRSCRRSSAQRFTRGEEEINERHIESDYRRGDRRRSRSCRCRPREGKARARR